MRPLLALATVLTALLVGASTAGACSCVGGDPRDQLSGARAAFVGTVTGERRTSALRRTYRLTVEKTFKGALPASVEVFSDGGSSCGIDLEVGQRVGLLLRSAAGPYEVGLCDLIEPEDLEAATRPYPRGAGRGTAKLLASGSFHDAGLAALDGRGRLLGWAFGSTGDAVSACPGARFAVLAGDQLSVIRLRDLAVVGRRALPDDAVSAVRCLSRSADSVAAFTFRRGALSERQRLVLVRDSHVRRLGVRASPSVVLGIRFAYAAIVSSRSHRIVAIDYASGRTRTLFSGSGSAGSLRLSPDGRRLAFVSAPRLRPPYRLNLLSTRTGGTRTRRLDRLRAPLWLSEDRVAVPGDGRPGEFFDARLRRRGAVASWPSDLAVALGRRVWWLEYGGGLRGRTLGDRSSRRVRVDYLGAARDLVAIPEGARVASASRRAPSARVAAAGGATSPCGRRARQ